MKLRRIHLKEGESLGILRNFTHEFSGHSSDSIEPLCLVGQNGTGKSRLLQCLAEIFYDLDYRCRHDGKGDRDYAVKFTYELEYDLKIDGTPLRVRTIKESENSRPKIERLDGMEWIETKDPKKLLPDRIVGYTSGQNETLSWPFHQLRTEYSKAVTEAAIYGREEVLDDYTKTAIGDGGLQFKSSGSLCGVFVKILCRRNRF